MNRLLVAAILIFALVTPVLSQHEPGPRPPMGPPPGGPPGQGPLGPPPGGPMLWPAGAKVEQIFELRGDELERTLQDYEGLKGVRAMRVVDYTVPGPPAPPQDILDFYARTLREPAWRSFFKSSKGGPDVAAVAYRGPGGFISVLARPRGATVTHIEGEIELSDLPTLERVVREAVARRERVPLQARDRVQAAVRLAGEGRTDEALAELRSVISDYPMADAAYFNLAKLLVEKGQIDEAGDRFRDAIALAPLNAAFRAEYARYLSVRGDTTNAEYELSQAATIDPWSAPLQIDLGRLMETNGALQDAEKHYRRAIELVGNSPELYFDLGRVIEKQGRRKDALAAYKNALKLKSDYAPARDAVRRLEGRKDI